MTNATTHAPAAATTAVDSDLSIRLEHLTHAIEHAAHLLPAQGPITVFIHHNTLHAFEELTFHEGIKKGGQVFGCQVYLSEDRYRQELARERIRVVDLVAVLREELGPKADAAVLDDRVPGLGSRLELRLAMLRYPIRLAPTAELRWFVAETDALTRYRPEAPASVRERFLEQTRHWVMRDVRPAKLNGARAGQHSRAAITRLLDHFGATTIERWSSATWEAFSLQALWRVCRDGVHGAASPVDAPTRSNRHRDLVLEATGQDSDLLVHDVLIRFCAAFLDQGVSTWPLPDREQGFFRAFSNLYRQPGGPPNVWLRGLPAELARIDGAGLSPLESVYESLKLLGVAEAEWDEFLTDTLLALRGWGGMIRQMEVRADRAAHPAPTGSLLEFLAVRLILERFALAEIAREALGRVVPLDRLREELPGPQRAGEFSGIDRHAFLVFQLAQVLGWPPGALDGLSKDEWATLLGELEAFDESARRRVFHDAFERRYRGQVLDAVAAHADGRPPRVPNAKFQTICCIDEREESFRRHLEEIAPDTETFGVAGFFSVAMYYRGASEAHYVPLCPIVVRPKHWVEEDVAYTMEDVHRSRAKTRRVIGTASHQFHVGSRTFAGGAFLTATLGVLASIPLVMRVLFPRRTAWVRKLFASFLQPPPVTQLQLERSQPEPGPAEGQIGYSLEEMTGIAERMLRDIGLTSNFSRLVLVLGHGSNSLNNPHNSAYNCGACGGSAGGPNARAMAQIVNDPRVRENLAERGLTIPHEAYFIGAYHNTCNDSVTYFDLDRLPRSHQKEYEDLRTIIDATCDRNAHERCRRFQSAPLDLSFKAARRHVEARSEDLSQTRPECGHATNAICYVGRRSRVRGLFLDRRAFMNSYDPTQDDENRAILTRTLQAAVPVCAGINLEYYFSYVDPSGWGCGTKLPHNVASLLGVMDGAASDLRTGLPWQMVEIHDPVRLLFLIETTPDAMTAIMDRNEGIGQLCRNGWVQLALLDPASARIHLLRPEGFVEYQPETKELPRAASSADWYRGWREHLGFAVIGK